MKSIKTKTNQNKLLTIWLLILGVMIALMVTIGGITRLTDSGLSMVEWRPFIGIIPPLSEKEWIRVFNLYKLTPEYLHYNFNMNLHDFKVIFFWEYFHRFWGRLIGLIFLVPLCYFWVTNNLPQKLKLPLLFLFLLGLIQSLVGWWMVKSGLISSPDVSHYRLATHLVLALFIYCMILWLFLDLVDGTSSFLNLSQLILFTIIFLTITFGAFVSGMNAGLLYNEYPLMGETFVPSEYGKYGFLDPFENPASVQFHHRCLAFLTIISISIFSYKIFNRGMQFKAIIMTCIIFFQFLIGIITLLYAVPIWSAALHQFGAILILTYLTYIVHCINIKI